MTSSTLTPEMLRRSTRSVSDACSLAIVACESHVAALERIRDHPPGTRAAVKSATATLAEAAADVDELVEAINASADATATLAARTASAAPRPFAAATGMHDETRGFLVLLLQRIASASAAIRDVLATQYPAITRGE